jgi:hypothetical protein
MIRPCSCPECREGDAHDAAVDARSEMVRDKLLSDPVFVGEVLELLAKDETRFVDEFTGILRLNLDSPHTELICTGIVLRLREMLLGRADAMVGADLVRERERELLNA